MRTFTVNLYCLLFWSMAGTRPLLQYLQLGGYDTYPVQELIAPYTFFVVTLPVTALLLPCDRPTQQPLYT